MQRRQLDKRDTLIARREELEKEVAATKERRAQRELLQPQAKYTKKETLRDKLFYAIHNCTAIDADDTSTAMQTAALGWGAWPLIKAVWH